MEQHRTLVSELWYHVFCFLPTVDGLNCRSVCTEWRNIVDSMFKPASAQSTAQSITNIIKQCYMRRTGPPNIESLNWLQANLPLCVNIELLLSVAAHADSQHVHHVFMHLLQRSDKPKHLLPAMPTLCKYGHMMTIKYICDNIDITDQARPSWISEACSTNQLRVVQFLHQRCNALLLPYADYDQVVCDLCGNDNLELLQYVYLTIRHRSHNLIVPPDILIECCMTFGNERITKWLYHRFKHLRDVRHCTLPGWALCRNGSSGFIIWVLDTFPIINHDTEEMRALIITAIRTRKLSVAKHICSKYLMTPSERTLTALAWSLSTNLISWYCSESGLTTISDDTKEELVSDLFVASDVVDVLQYLHDRFDLTCAIVDNAHSLLTLAYVRSHLSVIIWLKQFLLKSNCELALHALFGENTHLSIMDTSIDDQHGNQTATMEMFQWFYDNHNTNYDDPAIVSWLLRAPRLHVVKWICDTYHPTEEQPYEDIIVRSYEQHSQSGFIRELFETLFPWLIDVAINSDSEVSERSVVK